MEQPPVWLWTFHRELDRRHRQDVLPFKSIISAYFEAIHREEALQDDNDSLREQQGSLEAQLVQVSTELAAIKQGGGVDSRKLTDLQAKYDNLKEEQTQLYRIQSGHVQKLLDLNEQVKSKDVSAARAQQDLERSQADQDTLKQGMEGLRAKMGEKDLTIQIMQDELTALQLELLQTDDKIARLEEENKGLLERLVKFSNAPEYASASAALKKASMQSSHCPSEVSVTFNVEGKKELINTLVLSPKGDDVALCTSYPNVSIHSIASGVKVRHLWGGPKTGITAGAFNKSEELFVGTTTSTGSSNPSVYLWHVPTEKIRSFLAGHDGLVTGVSFLRGDDTKIVTGSHDHTLRLYDLPRGLCLKTIETNSAVTSVLTGSFGILTTHQDGTICRWDDRTGALLAASAPIHSRAIVSAIFSQQSDEIITVSLDHTIKSVDLGTLSPTHTFAHEAFRVPSEGGLPSLSPDGKFLAAGSSNGSVYIWNKGWNGELETILTRHSSAVVATAWSAKSRALVSADRTGMVCTWK